LSGEALASDGGINQYAENIANRVERAMASMWRDRANLWRGLDCGMDRAADYGGWRP
jgi:hypothetical protein